MPLRIRARRRLIAPLRRLLVLASAAVVSAPLHAQEPARFDTGIVVGGDWLQANALPLDRNAMQSAALNVSFRRRVWALDAGWLRVARTLNTVQGVSVSAGPLLHWGRVLFIPAVGVLGGKSYASRDSTGYDWVGPNGLTGHVPRYSYSSAASAGGGVALTVECPVYRAVGIRARAAQWFFSGAPLTDDRPRTLVGAGVSVRVGR